MVVVWVLFVGGFFEELLLFVGGFSLGFFFVVVVVCFFFVCDQHNNKGKYYSAWKRLAQQKTWSGTFCILLRLYPLKNWFFKPYSVWGALIQNNGGALEELWIEKSDLFYEGSSWCSKNFLEGTGAAEFFTQIWKGNTRWWKYPTILFLEKAENSKCEV